MKIKVYSLLLITAAIVCDNISFGQKKSGQGISTKIESLIKQMTLEEKIHMLHASSSFTSGGVERLGIPEWKMSDGPHGVRPEFGRDWVFDTNIYDSGTALPTGNCLAATWNPSLGYAFGAVLGSEANFRGKDVILGPGINIIRSPLNGRNFEYLSEDPFLVSKMAAGYVKGVQDQGISACVKHYAANNQEILRTSIDVQMSERALREIYLPGFKAAVDAGVNTVMGSYNKFRGQWATQNNYLMNQILKKEWEFEGVVISDWGAVHSTAQAAWNGCDLEMGTDLSMLPKPDFNKFYFADSLLWLVKNHKIPEYLINDKVRRILSVMFKTSMINGGRKKGDYNTKQHQQTALKVAEEGIVLLKNQNNFLPLHASEIKKIAVIGVNASRLQSLGGGSSQVKAFYEITPLTGIRNIAGNKINVTYNAGHKIERGATADQKLINDAAEAAGKADVAIIVGGWTHGYDYNVWADNAYDAEDADKPDMQMPFGQNELIKAVLKANPKTIVVIMGGGGIDMSEWINGTKAIVQAWYPGMEGGNALAKILFGQVNPSGKLPVTFAKKLADVPAHQLGEYPGNGTNVYYYDDIYVGYRYYDTFNVEPLFPFGHGLSYTTFKYSNLKVTSKNKKATVNFTLTNTGKLPGAEIAQLYVKHHNPSLPRPEKELKAFEKVYLRPGESKQITVYLKEDAFHYFNDVINKWVLEPGTFSILVGRSSRDIKLTGKINL